MITIPLYERVLVCVCVCENEETLKWVGYILATGTKSVNTQSTGTMGCKFHRDQSCNLWNISQTEVWD